MALVFHRANSCSCSSLVLVLEASDERRARGRGRRTSTSPGRVSQRQYPRTGAVQRAQRGGRRYPTGARAVPSRSRLVTTHALGWFESRLASNALRPGTGRAPSVRSVPRGARGFADCLAEMNLDSAVEVRHEFINHGWTQINTDFRPDFPFIYWMNRWFSASSWFPCSFVFIRGCTAVLRINAPNKFVASPQTAPSRPRGSTDSKSGSPN
jgi:hypothetical protein